MRSVEAHEHDAKSPTSESRHDATPGKATRAQDATTPSAFEGATWETAEAGQPLPGDLRAQFEASLGADLASVRVHPASSSATAIGAKAYAKGQDIHFAPGRYDPKSAEGRELLAHEVAHTVQQRGVGGPPQRKGDVSNASDAAEVEADTAASAMTRGVPAQVSAASSARVMAKSDREVQLDAIKASLAKLAWSDVALRLNGLSDDDIKAQVSKFSFGQLAHVREAAVAAMPGWSQRVTEAIDAADNKAKDVADFYTQYEAALATAKTGGGSWSRVAELLHGMGDWDIDDRLGRLDWFQLMEIKKVASPRISTAVDRADAKRVQRAQAAYRAALAVNDWTRVAAQLNGFDDGGIERSLNEIAAMPNGVNKLRYLRNDAVRLMPDHHQRVTGPLDRILAERAKDPQPEDEEAPYAATVELPDVSDDTRPLKGTPLENFGGNVKVLQFAQALANVYAERKVKSDPKVTADGRFKELEIGFASTGKALIGQLPDKFAVFARAWMSELREHCDSTTTLAMKGGWHRSNKAPVIEEAELEDLVGGASGGQKVHPIINKFAAQIAGSAAFSTYPNHGGKQWGPFCLDLFPKLDRDDRGLYSRGAAMQFISKLDAIVAGLDGDWSSCYNDATFNAAANAKFDNRFAFAGDLGTGNWHGALKLHFHLYIVPKSGGPGSARSAPTLDPSKE